MQTFHENYLRSWCSFNLEWYDTMREIWKILIVAVYFPILIIVGGQIQKKSKTVSICTIHLCSKWEAVVDSRANSTVFHNILQIILLAYFPLNFHYKLTKLTCSVRAIKSACKFTCIFFIWLHTQCVCLLSKHMSKWAPNGISLGAQLQTQRLVEIAHCDTSNLSMNE